MTREAVRRAIADPYNLTAAALVVLMGAVTLQGHWVSDFWTHSATLAELIAHPTDPADPLVGGDRAFPYYSPYLLVLAGLARLTGLGAVATLEVVGLPVLVFVLWAVRRFVAVFSPRPRVAVLFLLFTLVLWGVRPWFYSGMFNLGTLSLALAWPSLLAFGLMLTVWRALCGFAAAPSRGAWLVLATVPALVILIHPFTALNTAIGAVALMIGRWRDRPLRDLGLLAAAAAISVGLASLWPYYSLPDLLVSPASFDSITRYLFVNKVAFFCLLAVGLPVLGVRFVTDRRDPLAIMFLFATGVVAAAALLDHYSWGRVIPVAALALHLGLALEIGEGAWRSRPAARPWLVGVTAVACLVGLWANLWGLTRAVPPAWLPDGLPSAARTPTPAYPDYSWVGAHICRGDVVETDSWIAGRVIPTYGARQIAPPWPDPFVTDAAVRERAHRAFLGTQDSSERETLADDYAVRWVLDVPGFRDLDAALVGWTPVATGPDGSRLLARGSEVARRGRCETDAGSRALSAP